MKYVLVLSLFVSFSFATDDAELYKKLKTEISKKNDIVHKEGDLKVVVKNKDTNLTKKIKNLMKKEDVAKVTQEYEAVLKN
jgi:hypothetical protein